MTHWLTLAHCLALPTCTALGAAAYSHISSIALWLLTC